MARGRNLRQGRRRHVGGRLSDFGAQLRRRRSLKLTHKSFRLPVVARCFRPRRQAQRGRTARCALDETLGAFRYGGGRDGSQNRPFASPAAGAEPGPAVGSRLRTARREERGWAEAELELGAPRGGSETLRPCSPHSRPRTNRNAALASSATGRTLRCNTRLIRDGLSCRHGADEAAPSSSAFDHPFSASPRLRVRTVCTAVMMQPPPQNAFCPGREETDLCLR